MVQCPQGIGFAEGQLQCNRGINGRVPVPALRGGRRELLVAHGRHAYRARATGEAGEGADNDNDTNTKVSDQGATKRLYVGSNDKFRGCGCPFVLRGQPLSTLSAKIGNYY